MSCFEGGSIACSLTSAIGIIISLAFVIIGISFVIAGAICYNKPSSTSLSTTDCQGIYITGLVFVFILGMIMVYFIVDYILDKCFEIETPTKIRSGSGNSRNKKAVLTSIQYV